MPPNALVDRAPTFCAGEACAARLKKLLRRDRRWKKARFARHFFAKGAGCFLAEITGRGGSASAGAIWPEPIGREAPHLIGEAREIEGNEI